MSSANNMNNLLGLLGYTQIMNEFLARANNIINIPVSIEESMIDELSNDIYTEDNIILAESYFRSLISTENIDNPVRINRIQNEILKVVVELWISNINGSFPTIEEILNELFRVRCHCTYEFNDNEIKELYKYYVVRYGKIPNCQTTQISIEFFHTHRRFPTVEEINETMRRMILFYNSPEAFHQQDKIEVGVDNLQYIPILNMKQSEFKQDTDFCCSLCQEEIKDGQNYVKLNPCGHIFHYNDKECLEDACIFKWLSKNNKCPNCKQQVVVDLNEKKEDEYSVEQMEELAKQGKFLRSCINCKRIHAEDTCKNCNSR